MINRILVATDLSDKSEMALKRAFLLAKEWSSELFILHVAKKSFFGDFIVKNIKKDKSGLSIEKEAEHMLDKKVQSFLNEDITINLAVVSGSSATEILDFINKNKIDFLVLGAHGDYFFHDWFLGSTAENVIRYSPCPILIVKNKSTRHYHKIIAAVDFSETSKKVVELSSELIPEADYTILHVADPWYEETLFAHNISENKMKTLLDEMTFELMKKMNTFIKNCSLPKKLHTTIKTGYPAKAINEIADQINSDLIVIGVRGQSNLYYALIGSVANRILHEVNVDVLMIPPLK